ncbi:hypothetical protein GCM10010052_41870 [Paenarthrobacter histidinolovorans]|nr:hypothetical protein GCM10010052_41870 [Paenarthrobacter histidinolovorans]
MVVVPAINDALCFHVNSFLEPLALADDGSTSKDESWCQALSIAALRAAAAKITNRISYEGGKSPLCSDVPGVTERLKVFIGKPGQKWLSCLDETEWTARTPTNAFAA